MLFWDTTAVAPLLVSEASTADARRVLDDDPDVLVWWTTPVECLSAIARREREGVLETEEADDARAVLEALRGTWSEVLPAAEVRERAELLLLRQPVRAADALQLGAALTWARGRPRGHEVCVLDERLAEAARREGFSIALGP